MPLDDPDAIAADVVRRFGIVARAGQERAGRRDEEFERAVRA